MNTSWWAWHSQHKTPHQSLKILPDLLNPWAPVAFLALYSSHFLAKYSGTLVRPTRWALLYVSRMISITVFAFTHGFLFPILFLLIPVFLWIMVCLCPCALHSGIFPMWIFIFPSCSCTISLDLHRSIASWGVRPLLRNILSLTWQRT